MSTADDRPPQMQPPGSAESAAVPEEEQTRAAAWWRPVLLLGLLVTVLVLARVFGLGDRLSDLRDWIRELGPLGVLVFVVIYVGWALPENTRPPGPPTPRTPRFQGLTPHEKCRAGTARHFLMRT